MVFSVNNCVLTSKYYTSISRSRTSDDQLLISFRIITLWVVKHGGNSSLIDVLNNSLVFLFRPFLYEYWSEKYEITVIIVLNYHFIFSEILNEIDAHFTLSNFLEQRPTPWILVRTTLMRPERFCRIMDCGCSKRMWAATGAAKSIL